MKKTYHLLMAAFALTAVLFTACDEEPPIVQPDNGEEQPSEPDEEEKPSELPENTYNVIIKPVFILNFWN